MKKKIFLTGLLLFCIMAISSCNKNEKVEEVKPEEVQSQVEVETSGEVDEEHTPENSLDWEGTYKGVITYEDDRSEEVELNITSENTFTYKKRDAKEESQFTVEEGQFTWIEGYIIELDTKDEKTYFIAGENYVELSDKDGKELESNEQSNYILEKNMD